MQLSKVTLNAVTFLLILMMTLDQSHSGSRRQKTTCPRMDIPNAIVRIQNRGTFAKIKCLSGFTMIEGEKRLICVRKKWYGQAPKCIARGCLVPELKNGEAIELYDGALIHFICNPGYALDGSSGLFCNGRIWNASVPLCKVPTPNEDHRLCTFEAKDLCGWTQDHLDDFDWVWTSGLLNAFPGSLGAEVDHTFGTSSGHYLVADSNLASLAKISTARIFSPIFPVPVQTPLCVSFFYHAYGGILNAYLRPEAILFELITPALSLRGVRSDSWKIGLLYLTDFLEDYFQVIIEAKCLGRVQCTLAIDDFEVTWGDECIALEILVARQEVKKSSTAEVPEGAMESTTPVEDHDYGSEEETTHEGFSTASSLSVTSSKKFNMTTTNKPKTTSPIKPGGPEEKASTTVSAIPATTESLKTTTITTSTNATVKTGTTKEFTRPSGQPTTSPKKIFITTPVFTFPTFIIHEVTTPEPTLPRKTLTPLTVTKTTTTTSTSTTTTTITIIKPPQSQTKPPVITEPSTIPLTTPRPLVRTTSLETITPTPFSNQASTTSQRMTTTAQTSIISASAASNSNNSSSNKQKISFGVATISIIGLAIGCIVAGTIIAILWIKKKKQSLGTEDNDFKRLEEEPKDEETTEPEGGLRRPFSISYRILQDNTTYPTEYDGTAV